MKLQILTKLLGKGHFSMNPYEKYTQLSVTHGHKTEHGKSKSGNYMETPQTMCFNLFP